MMIDRYVEALSTYANDIDNLILLIGVLVGFWLVLCELIFFYFIVRFRARDGQRAEYITGEEKSHKRWISYPHMLVLVCDVFIVFFAIKVWYDVKQQLPEPYETVRIVGQQWAWSFVHPGADHELGTADDIKTVDELHVEVGKVYHFKLESRDVLHSFSVPVFRLKQDAVPGRVITGWFEAKGTGTHDIQCAEICGIGHGLMPAQIFIESPEQHAAWVAEQSPVTLASANQP
jgi:cytochrome c oxidase subunit 2